MSTPHITAESLRTYALKIDAKTGRLIGYTQENDGGSGNYHAQRMDAQRLERPPAPAPRYTERHDGDGDPGTRLAAAIYAVCDEKGLNPLHLPDLKQAEQVAYRQRPDLKLAYARWSGGSVREGA